MSDRIENALKVIALDPRIAEWLAANDPKALAQARQALGLDSLSPSASVSRSSSPSASLSLSLSPLVAGYRRVLLRYAAEQQKEDRGRKTIVLTPSGWRMAVLMVVMGLLFAWGLVGMLLQ